MKITRRQLKRIIHEAVRLEQRDYHTSSTADDAFEEEELVDMHDDDSTELDDFDMSWDEDEDEDDVIDQSWAAARDRLRKELDMNPWDRRQ